MFELEAGTSRATTVVRELPAIDERPDPSISKISLFSWEEHCTECAVPACYSTCALYESRPDGRCRRFMNGFMPLASPGSIQGYWVGIQFKQWASLFATANTYLVPLRRARFAERLMYRLDRLIARLPDHRISIAGRRGPAKRLFRRAKHWLTQSGILASRDRSIPDRLLLEIYNPSDKVRKLSLSIRRAVDEPALPYQELLECKPGFNRFAVSYESIVEKVGHHTELRIALTPNIVSQEHEGQVLYFRTLAFVLDKATTDNANREYEVRPDEDRTQRSGPKVKVLVWDLDNTLWDGIFVEDGAEALTPRNGVTEVLKQLDQRGILQSVASKNNPEPVLDLLESFGMRKYFLFPKISWGTKADAIAELAREFNVGMDTIAFVDDSEFEREYVRRVHPDVRVYDASEYSALLDKPEFNPIASTEATRRRYYYAMQSKRESAKSSFSGHYLEFLEDCKIEIDIVPGSFERLDRMFELITRTNQLNYSGNVYSKAEIQQLISSDRHATYCVDCKDRFGEYGMIGFALIDREENLLVDMALSCRVQGKRVEHALLSFLVARYGSHDRPFKARYRQTDRNRDAAAVFEDLGFSLLSRDAHNLHVYEYLQPEPPTQEIIQIKWGGNDLSNALRETT